MAQYDDAAVSVRELGSDAHEAWDTFVRSRPDGSFFHLSGWKRVIEASFGHSCHYLMAYRGPRLVGLMPTTFVSSRLFGRALISNGFCVHGGPLVEDGEAASALHAAAVGIARERGADYFECRGAPRDSEDGWRAQDGLYAGFRKAITDDHDANMKAIPRKQRAMVRKAQQNGLTSVLDATTDRLHALYAESVRNLGTPVFPKGYFRRLKESFGEAVQVLTVEHDGTPVASVMSFRYGRTILPYYGGGSKDARRLAANDFMYWEVMRRAADDGCTEFDFGRSKVGTGSFAFKKNWGFEPEPITYWFRLINTDTVPDKSPLNPRYRRAIAVWRRLPLWATNAIGPWIARGLA